MWAGLGLRCPMRLVGDVVTAFAAGTPSPSGRALIAGTGAIAAHITDHEIAATADGLGWLLGDEGSGRWIGLQALRHTVRNWPPPAASASRGHGLSAAVAAHARAASADALIAWAQALPLADIDALAPLVCIAATAGDPAAAGIVTAAASKLLATLDKVGGCGPVVLAGGLLAGDTPLRDQVRTALQARAIPTATSHDPAAAAAWLAARTRSPLTPADLHATLLH
jgi:N-acetylglucosamine kinase-like BadF-type ATPase